MPTTTSQTEHRWLSLAEVATHFGVTDRTVRRMVEAGDLPAYRLGKRLVRFERADVESLPRPIPNSAQPDSLADYIARALDAAPPLTDSQRHRLAGLLGSGGAQ